MTTIVEEKFFNTRHIQKLFFHSYEKQIDSFYDQKQYGSSY